MNDTHEHISFIYFATSDTRELNPAPGEQQDGFRWFTKEELDDDTNNVAPRVRHYGKEALKAAKK